MAIYQLFVVTQPFGKKFVQRNGNEGGVGEIGVAVDEGLLGGLNDGVVVVRAAFAHVFYIEIVEDIKNFERGHALRVRRKVAGCKAPVVHAYGFYPVGLVRGKVLKREHAAVLFQIGHDFFRNAALVEFRGAFFGNGAQR